MHTHMHMHMHMHMPCRCCSRTTPGSPLSGARCYGVSIACCSWHSRCCARTWCRLPTSARAPPTGNRRRVRCAAVRFGPTAPWAATCTGAIAAPRQTQSRQSGGRDKSTSGGGRSTSGVCARRGAAMAPIQAMCASQARRRRRTTVPCRHQPSTSARPTSGMLPPRLPPDPPCTATTLPRHRHHAARHRHRHRHRRHIATTTAHKRFEDAKARGDANAAASAMAIILGLPRGSSNKCQIFLESRPGALVCPRVLESRDEHLMCVF